MRENFFQRNNTINFSLSIKILCFIEIKFCQKFKFYTTLRDYINRHVLDDI